jgi:hypothetical protein
VGIDTANDYNDQGVISEILNPYIAQHALKRSDFFITTKVPAGFGGAAACKAVRNDSCHASAACKVQTLDLPACGAFFAGPRRLAEHSKTEPAAAEDRLRGSRVATQTVPDC